VVIRHALTQNLSIRSKLMKHAVIATIGPWYYMSVDLTFRKICFRGGFVQYLDNMDEGGRTLKYSR